MGATVAYPLTDRLEAAELDDTAFQLDRSCFESVPSSNAHASYRLGSLASG